MSEFDVALQGDRCWLELATGERIELAVRRWQAESEPSDEMMLAHCSGPTLDVGCGPGRLTTALTQRGIPALGIDVSPIAVRLTLSRGGVALERDIFDPIPGEGRWHSVVLADGNIGIGGDPVRLLRRIRRLISRTGKVLVELEPPGTGLRQRLVRLNGAGNWFQWAWVGAAAIEQTAAEAGFRTRWLAEGGGRWFTELVHR